MTLVLQIRVAAPNTAESPRNVGGSVLNSYGFTWMLMGGALERLEAAQGHIESGSVEAAHALLESAVIILHELRADLDLLAGGAVAANVDDLYDYMCRRLRAADLENGFAALDEVSHLLDALRSAWAFMPAELRSASGN